MFMAKAQEKKPGFFAQIKQIGLVFKFTAKADRWFMPLVAAAVLIPLALTVVAALLWGWVAIPLGIMIILLAVLIVLNLRSNSAMMNSMEGQTGAAVQLISNMRGDWRVNVEKPLAMHMDKAQSALNQMDVVHAVIGRPGVILIAEGQPHRLRQMLGEQKRRLGKVIGDAPLYDYIIGNEEGQLPIRKLRMTLLRLPRNLSGKEVNQLDKALTALTARPTMPRGQLPKDLRPPKGAMRQMRGR
ncbi:membrane protein [Rhizocola hellebori]|uniref:Membrane protein n=2 Tax=Rhizocola hellebori TaxID=1392758 RepID=A0A8J3QEI1_9ACTN|nr:membrane protein [Rhizocola hellebori]